MFFARIAREWAFSIVEQCRAAGAKTVYVFDNTCDNWRSSYRSSGIEQAVRDVTGIPSKIGVLSLLSIGRPGEEKEARTQYDPDRVHVGQW